MRVGAVCNASIVFFSSSDVAMRGNVGGAPREIVDGSITLVALVTVIRRESAIRIAMAIDVAIAAEDVCGHEWGTASGEARRIGEYVTELRHECLA